MLLAAESCATAAVAPTLDCEAISTDRADRIGVDRFGYLWLWDQKASTVRWLDPDGEMLDVTEIPESRAVDADQEWGVAAVSQIERANLRILRPGDSKPSLDFTLPEEVASVAWIDRDRVAVAPTRADSLVEIWDLAERRRVRSLGSGHRIEVGPGMTFVRVLALQPDPAANRLFTLDSLRGNLRVLSLDGEMILDTQVEAHALPGLEEWRRDHDRRVREQGNVQTPLHYVLDLEADSDGRAFVVERCSEDRTQGTWALLTPSGEIERSELRLALPVCSLRFTRWKDQWVFASTADGGVSRPYLCWAGQKGDSR